AISVLDMWAYLADILTFYQERTANEAYLRTALLKESVQRLAGLLDYRPAPGAAAVVLVAFTLEPARKLLIPAGQRVQSVPGENEKAQKFETVEVVAAEDVLNRIPILPAPAAYSALDAGHARGILTSKPAPAGTTRLVAFTDGTPGAEEKEVVAVEQINGRTELTWSPAMVASK